MFSFESISVVGPDSRYHGSFLSNPLGLFLLALEIGVRGPLSMVNGSRTRVAASVNAKPHSCNGYIMQLKGRSQWAACKKWKMKRGEDWKRQKDEETLPRASLAIALVSARTGAFTLGSLHNCAESSFCTFGFSRQSVYIVFKVKNDLSHFTISVRILDLLSVITSMTKLNAVMHE